MNISINMENKIDKNIKINYLLLQKMAFVYNALEDGWQISKNDEKYIFLKKHEEKKEVFLDTFLENFINNNIDINKIK